ncbi:hypothetical protein [Frigidibacter sp. MR17.24]|uniref:hypothetical protein n=1 Tax=Frigidibacter sp. MR17.24 TaxID=3127345 RepID=UPI003012C0F9
MPAPIWTRPEIIAARAYDLDGTRIRRPIGAINHRVSLAQMPELPAAHVIASTRGPGSTGGAGGRL